MLATLQLYYMAVSGALFLYALYTPACAIRAFPVAIATNIFPLALLPYMSMDIARLGGMPLVYLPVTAVGMAMVLRNGPHLPKRYLSFYVLVCVYLAYTFCNTVLARGLSVSNLVYWLAWPVNFLMFIAAAAITARTDPRLLDRMLNRCVLVLVAASVVGLARYLAGIGTDSNFIPLMNRNGTVVLLTLLFPLVLHVHATQNKSRLWLAICGGTIALCVALTFSRSGLVGLMAGLVLYYWRFSIMGILKLGAAIVVVALFLSSGVAERTSERLLTASTTVSAMLEGRDVERSVSDYNRVMLINAAIDNVETHFWFGTGLGMENYREGLRKASPLPVTSKAHNFYLSYMAELGIFGFVVLLGILYRIFASLLPLGSGYRAFRVSFLVMALMMAMNEYILLPELWLYFGILAGISNRVISASSAIRAAYPAPWPSIKPRLDPPLSTFPRGPLHPFSAGASHD